MISILMPVRDGLPYLEECMDSILDQTYQNWELIVVDDNSSDKTYETLSFYANQDSRIKVLKNPQKGIISALRFAFANCSGDYITRMDADDIMPKHKLKILRNLLLSHGKGYLSSGKVKYFSDMSLGEGYIAYESWLNKLVDNKSHFEEIYKECVVPSPCWMIHRIDFEKCGAFSSDLYPEDYDLCFRFYKNKMQVVASSEILHLWRDYGNRTSRTDSNYSDQNFYDLKVKYFLDLELTCNMNVLLLGAGKKGKVLAKKFIDRGVDIKWYSNNQKKVGNSIYGIQILDEEFLCINKNDVLVMALSGPSDLEFALNSLKDKGYSKNKNYFSFF